MVLGGRGVEWCVRGSYGVEEVGLGCVIGYDYMLLGESGKSKRLKTPR